MFRKILIAEDIDSISLGLETALDAGGPEIVFSKYCDESFLKIKKAAIDSNPFDLLITDLSFKQSHMDVNLTSGTKLIEAIRREDYDIGIIVYSIEERSHKIRHLLDGLAIDGFVSKGRNSTVELLAAIKAVYKGEKYISAEMAHLKKPVQLTEIDSHDLEILQLLSEGLSQPEIEETLQKKNIKASSKSSIEKRIIKMKTSLQARNTTHLISIAKDMGLV